MSASLKEENVELISSYSDRFGFFAWFVLIFLISNIGNRFQYNAVQHSWGCDDLC